MTNAIIIAVFFVLFLFLGTQVFAQEMPTYMKGGVIVVTLKDGKSYKFAAETYAVVKRDAKSKPTFCCVSGSSSHSSVVEATAPSSSQGPASSKKNILSLGLVHSNHGFDVSNNGNTVDVEQKKAFAGSVMYQRQVKDNLYVGGRLDAHGSKEVNAGFAF